MQFQSGFLPAQSTTEVDYHANLASYPLTTDHDTAVPGSELLNPLNFSVNPLPNGAVVADDVSTFLNESVAGGAITAYDVSGAAVNIQLRWAKTDSSSLGSGSVDTWNLFYLTDSNATGTDPAWQNAGTDYTFGANGQLNPASIRSPCRM